MHDDTDQTAQRRAPQTDDTETIFMQNDEATTGHLPLHNERAQDGSGQEGAVDDAEPRPQRPRAAHPWPRERQTRHPPRNARLHLPASRRERGRSPSWTLWVLLFERVVSAQHDIRR